MPILTKEQLNEFLHTYYVTHYGARESDEWYEKPAVNVWVFGRDGKIITLKSHILTGDVTELVEEKTVTAELSPVRNERKNDMKRVCDFLKNAGVYYLATVEGDQPRVRPFGTAHVFEDKLYIQTGKIKPTSKQLLLNPKAEICAYQDGTWIRVSGELIEDERMEAKKSMLDAYHHLRAMYDENDGNTQVYAISDAVATFSSFGGAPEIVTF